MSRGSFAQSTPVKPLVSAVGHVLTLVASLAGGLAGGTGALERHPALGSLLRALCIRIPDTSVRRSACAVLYRASHWQALGQDASSSNSSSTSVAATADEGLAARSRGGAVPSGTSAAVSSSSAARKRTRGRSNDLARVLLACLRADLARVQTVPFARSNGPSAAVRVGLSPVRRARGGTSTTAAAANKTGEGGRSGEAVAVVVPRLHLVEVTSFVAGLVHVMLESARSSAAKASTAAAAAAAGPKEQHRPIEKGKGAHAPARQPPPLPARPTNTSSVLLADAAAAAHGNGEGVDGVGTTRNNHKNSEGMVAGTATAGDDPSSVDSEPVGGGEAGGGEKGEEERRSIAAAEWLLEEAARRLVAHEFTETFK